MILVECSCGMLDVHHEQPTPINEQPTKNFDTT
jgi:hypothetical protein